MAIKAIVFTFSVLICLTCVLSQRPSYAGSRPPNGHKDKYRPTQSPNDIELSNRFGEDTLSNGASQRPPQGVDVVNAEQSYIPITTNQVQTSGIAFNNRINENPQNSVGTSSRTTVSPVAPNRLPLDAHGDQQLIDHLNQLPIDNRPFWFINYQAIEAQRNGTVSNFGPIASRGSFFGK